MGNCPAIADHARRLVDTYIKPEFVIVWTDGFVGVCPDDILLCDREPCITTTILHEAGHYNLGHVQLDRRRIGYKELLECEFAAWLWAEEVAKRDGLTFDHDHAYSCFSTYVNDWRA